MPRLKDVRITDTMVKAAIMYEDGDNAAEIAAKLKRTREYILWSLRVQKIEVDEAKLTPDGKAGKKFIKEWYEVIGMLKKFMCLLLVVCLFSIPAEAACTTPGCVKRAAQAAMDETGANVAFVVKIGTDGKGTGYMMYRAKGKVHCDRSGQVILGRNTKINKTYHYSFYRNRDAEKKLQTFDGYRWRFTSYIECAEDDGFMVHSYIEYRQNGTWKTCKGVSKNTTGLAMCKEFARYLWSMADPDCPVVFM